MPYEVRYSEEALERLRKARGYDRAAIVDQIERTLMIEPRATSGTRVKLLRQPAPAQYRLRVGGFRVYYDVEENVVEILRILTKDESNSYLGGEP